MTNPGAHPTPPHEPEIELLARFARRGLLVLRLVFVIAGVAAFVHGTGRLLHPPPDDPAFAARHLVWFCAGLPLLLPVNWLFGTGRWLALTAFALLWALPILLLEDDPYGFVLRMFATLVACAALFVWRTLNGLTRSAPAR